MTDNIRPEHYRTGEIDLFESWYQTLPWEQFRAVMVSHAEKYMKRIKNDPVEDLEKARYVLWRLREKEIERNTRNDETEEKLTKDGIYRQEIKVIGVVGLTTYTEHEYLLKELADDGYKWLARDSDGELWAYNESLEKGVGTWLSVNSLEKVKNDNFPQIKWSDSEPTSIADLLETYENGGNDGK